VKVRSLHYVVGTQSDDATILLDQVFERPFL